MARVRGECYQKCFDETGGRVGSPEFDECMERCEKGAVEPPPGPGPEESKSPCKAGGYLGKQIKRGTDRYFLITPCRDGYKPVKAADGKIWCCKEDAGKEEKKEEKTEGVCEGGYKLASSPIQPSGGKIWTDNLITAAMGFIRNPGVEGHELYKEGKWYNIEDVHNAIRNNTLGSLVGREGGACKKGYRRKVINGEEWCCPEAEGGGGGGGGSGEFEFSPGLMDMLEKLRGRFDYFMEYPRGTTPEERQAVINYMVEGIRKGERGRIQSVRDLVSRMGLFGSGIQLEEEAKERRLTRELASQAREKVGSEEIDRRFRELMETTGMSTGIFNIMATIEQLKESLSAGRRGEGRESLNQLLSYLSLIMGGGSNSYWQAIMNYIMQGGGGADIWDWLPYMSYYLT